MVVARCLIVAVLCSLAPCLAPTTVCAHVGPSETVNNRYYKLTPMADRVRIVYSVFFGRDPGAVARRRMDTDRDGQLSEAEISAYGNTLQSEVERSTGVKLSGADAEIRWRPVEMGMGTSTSGGGAFSADLIGFVCLEKAEPDAEHRLQFTDRLRLPKPGETELRLDPAPGIRISRSMLGGRDIGLSGHKWQGGPGPAQAGYQMDFLVERQDSAGMDDSCKPPEKTRSRLGVILIVGFAVILVFGALFFVRRPRR